MDSLHWLAQNSFSILGAIGVVGGLLFTGISLRSETKTRRIANLLTLTQNHRALWSEYFCNPTVARVLDATADVMETPVCFMAEGVDPDGNAFIIHQRKATP